MATTTRTASARQPLARPRPGPAPTASTRRDYTQPPPGGAHYPWEPGGGSKIPGVPDNWSQFYPNEGEGRGDAWIGPKKAQLNAEHPPSSYQNMPSARSSMSPQDFAKYQQGALPQNQAAKDALAGMHDPSHDAPVAQGKPGVYDWQRGGWPQGTDQTALALKMHGATPGPLNKIGGAPGSGGTYQGGNTITPPAATGKTAAKTQAPATNDQLGKWFGTMKPGATMTIQGKKYFKNQNGAVVDVTNPAARKRITNQQGAFIGQAAAPPAPTPQTQPAATPPPTAAASSVDPQQFADMQQQFQQMQQMMQQGFGGGYGGGGYGGGGEQSYSGMPAQFSGFGNAIMQGMGGGGGYGGGMQSPYGMIQPDFMQLGGGYGGGGGYGMPQQFSQEMMGGYGDPYGGMGGMNNYVNNEMMGGGMDQLMGYNAGMGGYGAPGMGYY